jgi:hypothetical protein
MDFARFITRRYLKEASFTVSGTSGDMGPANLLDHDRTQVWRAPSGLEAYADFDLGEEKPWNAIVIVSHSLGYEGGFEIWAGSSPGQADILSETYDAWEPLWGYDECLYDEHGYDGFPTEEERERYFPAGSLRIIYLSQLIMARYGRLVMAGPAWSSEQNPDGLIQAGCIIPGYYFQADRPVGLPLPLGPEDNSILDYGPAGQLLSDEGPRFRAGRYTFEASHINQLMGPWYDALQEIGVGKPFVADFFPGMDSQVIRIRNQLYCHLVKINQPNWNRPRHGDIVLEVRESN